jgi:hypothetical protein
MIPHDHIQQLIDASELQIRTLGRKTTVLTCILPTGFEITVTASAALAEGYNEAIGTECCMSKLEYRLYELETYRALHP